MEAAKEDTSLYGFGTVTGGNILICVALIFVFSFVRSFDKNIYEPKTYMLASEKQPSSPPKGFFTWIIPTWKISDEYVLKMAGLDALMFLKFLRAAFFLFAGFTFISWAILIPLNILDRKDSQEKATFEKMGMELLTINGTDKNSYQWAHVSCLILFVFSVVALLYKSVIEYAELRQDCILQPEHSSTIKARTILVASIPKHMNNRKQLYDLFNIFPGGVKHVFVNRSVGSLSALKAQRDAMHNKLEQTMTRWIAMNVKRKLKQSATTQFVPPPRITHRVGFLGLVGKKVDSIEFYLHNILSLNRSINEIRNNKGSLPVQESAFILFNSQIGAHVAAQSLVSNHVLHFNPRYVESDPEDIIWTNLNFSAVQFMVRKKIGMTIAISIAVLWFIPSGIVSGFSKLEKLQEALPFIEHILPKGPAARGYIQAQLPSILSNILTALVPILYTFLSTLEGHPRTGDVQLSVMTKYFWFLVSTVLVGSALGSSFPELVKELNKIRRDTSYLFEVFAKTFATSSTFFINLVLLKALISSCQELLQIVNLIKRRLIVKLFVSSPRKHLQVIEMGGIDWGTTWPEHTLVFAIGLLYSVLAPVSNIAMTIYFLMFYLVYKYQVLYVYHTERNQTQGMFFMKAVSQIFVGIYIFLITFSGLMLLQKTEGIRKFTVAIVTLAFTICSHIFLVNKYSTVVNFISVQKAFATSKSGNVQGSEINLSMDSEYASETIPLRRMPDPSDYIDSGNSSPETVKAECLPPPDRTLENYFTHPDLVEPQPILWVPQDESGFSNLERSQVAGQAGDFMHVTTHGSTMDSNGRIALSQFSFPESAHDSIV